MNGNGVTLENRNFFSTSLSGLPMDRLEGSGAARYTSFALSCLVLGLEAMGADVQWFTI